VDDALRALATSKDLLRLCVTSPDLGARCLANGDVEQWLVSADRRDLARVASESRRAGADPVEALHLFIEYSRMQEFLSRTPGRRLSALLVGRTGVGKSSTLNTLAGREVAQTGEAVPTTARALSYKFQINGVPSRVVDTPGLADGQNLDSSYLERIRREIGQHGVDCMVFVTALHETRVRTDEIRAIEQVTQSFGAEIWCRSLVILTFSDYLADASHYKRGVSRRPEVLKKTISATLDHPGIADAIPFVPVTNDSDQNPDGRRWLGSLQLTLLQRLAPEGTALFRGPDTHGGRNDTRFRCHIRTGEGLPPYRFICRAEGTEGSCNFCGAYFKTSYSN
jgi:energy-coupling factor transporter ATP-binding protein EcfA2